VERKNVKGSYMHTSEYLEERKLMLQWWADYIDANKNGSITPYDFARVHGK
ncbi:TPA: integrase, partial [Klebsiella pneumoniae]|nr:integrase [Klebsiella pneumoniae]